MEKKKKTLKRSQIGCNNDINDGCDGILYVTEADVVKVRITSSMKKEAMEYAQKKLDNTINRPDLEDRTCKARLHHLYLGNLAVSSIVDWLERNEKWLEVYDRIRTDNFVNPDLGWDLCVRDRQDKILEVDVKSSGPSRNTPNLNAVLNRRNLATKPSQIQDNKIVCRGEERDINIQVYYLPRDPEHTYLISWASLIDLIILTPIPKYQRPIGSYSPTNPRLRYNTILKTLRKMESILPLLK